MHRFFSLIFISLYSSFAMSGSIQPEGTHAMALAGLGFGQSNDEHDVAYNLAAGIHINNYFELEVGHNEFGEVVLGEIDASSDYLGFNIGGPIGNSTRMYFIVGGEDFKANGYYKIKFPSGTLKNKYDESGSKAYAGIGWSFQLTEICFTRLTLTAHDDGKVRSLIYSVGAMF